MDVISTQGLKKGYANGKPVFSGVDIRIRSGERVALVGANGVGKSTLLKCLIGHTPFCDGEISTLGEAFRSAPSGPQLKRMRQQIGFVFQHHGLVRRQSVLTNVVHGKLGLPGTWRAWHQAIAERECREEAMDALDQVKLSHKATARADELSGGQAQRVAIARALVGPRRLLLADEPTGALDSGTGTAILELLRERADRGAAVMMVTHEARFAAWADRTVYLRDGRISGVSGPSDPDRLLAAESPAAR